MKKQTSINDKTQLKRKASYKEILLGLFSPDFCDYENENKISNEFFLECDDATVQMSNTSTRRRKYENENKKKNLRQWN